MRHTNKDRYRQKERQTDKQNKQKVRIHQAKQMFQIIKYVKGQYHCHQNCFSNKQNSVMNISLKNGSHNYKVPTHDHCYVDYIRSPVYTFTM